MRKKSDIRLKTGDEIRRIGESGRIIADIFMGIARMSLIGMTTHELDAFIESGILKKKGRPAFKTVKGYKYASCISINSEVVHGIPAKKRVIQSGDIVKIDTGAVLNGYFSDACRTIAAGRIPVNAEHLVNAAAQSLREAIDVMRPGNRIGDIGSAIQNHAESKGYSVVRKFFGHGTGFALHEPPPVPHYGRAGTGAVLTEGMVIAVEPIINEGSCELVVLGDGWTNATADGKLSAQFEHTVAVTGRGPVILTG